MNPNQFRDLTYSNSNETNERTWSSQKEKVYDSELGAACVNGWSSYCLIFCFVLYAYSGPARLLAWLY